MTKHHREGLFFLFLFHFQSAESLWRPVQKSWATNWRKDPSQTRLYTRLTNLWYSKGLLILILGTNKVLMLAKANEKQETRELWVHTPEQETCTWTDSIETVCEQAFLQLLKIWGSIYNNQSVQECVRFVTLVYEDQGRAGKNVMI
jgi:hypothetical protein